MPGIAGIITKDGIKINEIDQMIASMLHEKSYSFGKYINKEYSLYMGWVSHKDSFSDCMPVWNETKNICIIFSGEDFIDKTEIEDIRSRGHQFEVDNASYLVHLYEESEDNFFEKLNGWFSGVLIDLRKGKMILFNDRYGLGRIYYCEKEKGFYFSSEAKALLRVLPELRRVDFRGLAETFSCGCVMQNRTLFPGILLLPAGSRWIFQRNADVRKGKYFFPQSLENQKILNGAEYYEKLKETFVRILPKYFRGKRQVGMSLTGGLDGRLIMSWANRKPEELPCYTFGGSYHDCADVKIARKIANLCGQSHKTIIVDSQFFPEFPKLAEKSVFVSDGTMDITGSVELYVNHIASSISAVRLTGNYGSEIVRGNVAFRPGRLDEAMLEPEFAGLIRNAAMTYEVEYNSHRQSFIAFKQVPWYHYCRLSVEQSQLTIRSPYLDNDLVSLIYQASPEDISSEKPSLRLIAEGNGNLARIPTDRGVLYRPSPLIGKIRQAFQEFTVKSEYAYDYGMPHWLARIDHIFSPLHLERLFLGRHKFYHFRIWCRENLSKYLKDILLDPRTLQRPYLRGKIMEDMINSHIKGKRNYTLEIIRALTSELTQRQLIEQS